MVEVPVPSRVLVPMVQKVQKVPMVQKDSSVGVRCVGVGRFSEGAWNCLAHSQVAKTHMVAVKKHKKQNSCQSDGLCLCCLAPPKLLGFGIESFGCPCQVVDLPQIEYEDTVVEVPVQKHVQVRVKLPAGSLSVREGNAPLEVCFHDLPCRFTGHLV